MKMGYVRHGKSIYAFKLKITNTATQHNIFSLLLGLTQKQRNYVITSGSDVIPQLLGLLPYS